MKTINKTRKSMEWKKIFANDMNDKWLICKVYKQSSSNSISHTQKKAQFKNGQKT